MYGCMARMVSCHCKSFRQELSGLCLSACVCVSVWVLLSLSLFLFSDLPKMTSCDIELL